MSDKRMEKTLRNLSTFRAIAEDPNYEEVDQEKDDGELRIVFNHKQQDSISITFMYQV